MEVSLKIMQKALNDHERLDCWMRGSRLIVQERFNEWAESGEPVPLFKGMSNLVLTLLLHLFTGAEFAGRHAHELVPMIQGYETAMQHPMTKVFPRWMSREGRLMNNAEARMKVLIDEEVDKRLGSPDIYEKNMDYLQYILNTVGGKFKEGISSTKCILT